MSAVGHCGDNAASESFFGLLKRERIYHHDYRMLDEERSDVFDYYTYGYAGVRCQPR